MPGWIVWRQRLIGLDTKVTVDGSTDLNSSSSRCPKTSACSKPFSDRPGSGTEACPDARLLLALWAWRMSKILTETDELEDGVRGNSAGGSLSDVGDRSSSSASCRQPGLVGCVARLKDEGDLPQQVEGDSSSQKPWVSSGASRLGLCSSASSVPANLSTCRARAAWMPQE